MLGYEHGVGIRGGCFCAHPYVAHLLRLTPGEAGLVDRQGEGTGDKRGAPGLVRMSLGCSDRYDVDRTVEASALLT